MLYSSTLPLSDEDHVMLHTGPLTIASVLTNSSEISLILSLICTETKEVKNKPEESKSFVTIVV